MDTPAAALIFSPYGFTYWLVVAVTVVGAVLLVRLGRRHRDTAVGETLTRGFAIVQLTVTVGFMIVWLLPPFFDKQQSLPLHLSDLLRLVTAYALWSRRPWAFALTYYWGLTFNPHALLTPDLYPDIAPVLEIISYWLQHVLVMWAAVYLTWGLGLHPNWRSYRLALAVTLGWAAVVFGINRALGTNYGYLNSKPSGVSLLDLMGGWPWYLLVASGLMAVVWALITWPWMALDSGAGQANFKPRAGRHARPRH
jgi:hypothetical integral membrane protein (TIGR02206 family)